MAGPLIFGAIFTISFMKGDVIMGKFKRAIENIMVWYFVNGLSSNEIAERLNMTVDWVEDMILMHYDEFKGVLG